MHIMAAPTLGSPLPKTGGSGITLMWKNGPKILLTSRTRPFTWFPLGFHIGRWTSTRAKLEWDTSNPKALKYPWNGPNGEIFITLLCRSLNSCSNWFFNPSGSFSNRLMRSSRKPGGNVEPLEAMVSYPMLGDRSPKTRARNCMLGARDGSGGCGKITPRSTGNS